MFILISDINLIINLIKLVSVLGHQHILVHFDVKVTISWYKNTRVQLL